MPARLHHRQDPRWFGIALHVLLILAFVTGGSSQISGWDDAVVQLLSLPVLAYALWRLGQMPTSRLRTTALMVAGMLVLLPLIQLAPIPEWLWRMPEARQQLAADLAVVGASPAYRWSLAPDATERAILFLLPPLAAFVATLGLRRDQHRSLLRTIMLLAMFSVLLALIQFGVPQESLLNPFPRWAPSFNGVFANPNHQGTMLVLAIIIALTRLLAALPRVREGLRAAWTPWAVGFVALFSLCALPLTQSRGAVLIGTFAVGSVPVAMGAFTRRQLRKDWGARLALAGCLIAVALGVWATVGWMAVDKVEELRGPLRELTMVLGTQHAPLGAGVGAFVDAFEQAEPMWLLRASYANHAHNEYVQWWLEFSWLGVLVAIAAFALIWVASVRGWRAHPGERAIPVAAALGIAVTLLHSWVDYPLRTASLATVTGVLCGIVVALAIRSRSRGEIDLHDDAEQV